jgi:hypothetical protein
MCSILTLLVKTRVVQAGSASGLDAEQPIVEAFAVFALF